MNREMQNVFLNAQSYRYEPNRTYGNDERDTRDDEPADCSPEVVRLYLQGLCKQKKRRRPISEELGF